MVILSLVCFSHQAFADIKDAELAYMAEDYSWAVNELKPMAEKGNPLAQYYLGEMYSNGRGVWTGFLI